MITICVRRNRSAKIQLFRNEWEKSARSQVLSIPIEGNGSCLPSCDISLNTGVDAAVFVGPPSIVSMKGTNLRWTPSKCVLPHFGTYAFADHASRLPGAVVVPTLFENFSWHCLNQVSLPYFHQVLVPLGGPYPSVVSLILPFLPTYPQSGGIRFWIKWDKAVGVNILVEQTLCRASPVTDYGYGNTLTTVSHSSNAIKHRTLRRAEKTFTPIGAIPKPSNLCTYYPTVLCYLILQTGLYNRNLSVPWAHQRPLCIQNNQPQGGRTQPILWEKEVPFVLAVYRF